MSVLPRGVCGPCFWALLFSWEPQLYQYNRSRLPDRTRKHWRRLDHWNGRGHCGSGAHPRGDRALWRSVSETDLYPEGTRILRAVQEQVRTVRGEVCGKRGKQRCVKNIALRITHTAAQALAQVIFES